MFFIYNITKITILVTENRVFVDERRELKNMLERLSLYNAGSYFIHLYDKIDGAYGCSQIKLEKMILLAQIEYYLAYGMELMSGLDIVFAEECGFSLETKNIFFRSPISVSKEYKNSKLSSELASKLSVYKDSEIMYFNENDIDCESKNFLNDVFVKYASCFPRKLGEYLDNIKECKIFSELSAGNNHFEIKSEDFYKMVVESKFGEVQFIYE